jgi:hypothetical protein
MYTGVLHVNCSVLRMPQIFALAMVTMTHCHSLTVKVQSICCQSIIWDARDLLRMHAVLCYMLATCIITSKRQADPRNVVLH